MARAGEDPVSVAPPFLNFQAERRRSAGTVQRWHLGMASPHRFFVEFHSSHLQFQAWCSQQHRIVQTYTFYHALL